MMSVGNGYPLGKMFTLVGLTAGLIYLRKTTRATPTPVDDAFVDILEDFLPDSVIQVTDCIQTLVADNEDTTGEYDVDQDEEEHIILTGDSGDDRDSDCYHWYV
jgi:hypothetical protein